MKQKFSGVLQKVRLHPQVLVPVIVLFGFFGAILLIRSFAATGDVVAFESEQGTASGNVTINNGDTTASGGSFITFKPTTTPNPTPTPPAPTPTPPAPTPTPPAPSPTPTPPSSSTNGILSNFWKKFSRGPNPTGDTSYFPIAIWWQDVSDMALYASVGINLNLTMDCPSQNDLNTYKAAGMKAVISIDCTQVSTDTTIAGGLSVDEPDLLSVMPSQIASMHAAFRARDNTRPIYLNVTRGVNEYGYASCYNVTCGTQPGNSYDQYFAVSDMISADLYPIASGDPIQNVAGAVENMVGRVGTSKPVFNFIETTAIQHGQWYSGRQPTPDEVEIEVWMSIVYGATGISYFPQDFSDGTYSTRRMAERSDVMAKVKNVNGLIKSLAPVLNSPTISPSYGVSSGNIKTMAKNLNGTNYLFAVNMGGGNQTLSLSNVSSTTMTDMRTNATKNVSNRSFSESVEGYGIRIYRLN